VFFRGKRIDKINKGYFISWILAVIQGALKITLVILRELRETGNNNLGSSKKNYFCIISIEKINLQLE
jgi:hypothetical protein